MRRWMKLVIAIITMMLFIFSGMKGAEGYVGYLLVFLGAFGLFLLIEVNHEEND